ncbi:hypothetical protein A1O3_07767 [Capronia epimyces CBS 606.96]|uniref:Transcription factor domain-containing protein n=1 Tax=Capronia epimyces CBS 606.96 TaxID=1182542 RepID=W9XVV4_9EURO|nr:uncharacterized protein A1O3_07767 [Capronia epimyces CBS 606.96]EXJ81475.1 hypothetical protein A1O3_07767 [Capronia epimyces CBS 606.96]
MSSSGQNSQDSNSESGQRRGSGSRRPNLIEFVDSQDPNVRSAIQRHTAYHSAAQRRDARSRLLRRSSQTRYLEWGRRHQQSTEATPATSSASSASSVSRSPAPSGPEGPEAASRTTSNQTEQESEISTSLSETMSNTGTTSIGGPAISDNDSILQFYRSTFCEHSSYRDIFDSAIAYILEHDAARHLLLAYAYAMRWRLQASSETVQDQVGAQSHLGRGTNMLWNRLQMPGHASSDSNIQAVLLLLAYTADFGQASEIRLHADALRTMVEQRGGLDTFRHNPGLQQQLWAIEISRQYHLTLGCEPSCPNPLRFPDGLRLRAPREEDRRN